MSEKKPGALVGRVIGIAIMSGVALLVVASTVPSAWQSSF